MRMTGYLLTLALGVGLACAATAPQAQEPTPQTGNGIPYITGGVGGDQQQAMLAVRQDYNLRMTFATRGSGEFQAEVKVDILDRAGKQVLAVESAGPLFYARLAPGSYRVQATANGKMLSQRAAIKAGAARELYFYWAPEPDATPAGASLVRRP